MLQLKFKTKGSKTLVFSMTNETAQAFGKRLSTWELYGPSTITSDCGTAFTFNGDFAGDMSFLEASETKAYSIRKGPIGLGKRILAAIGSGETALVLNMKLAFDF